MCVLAFAWRAHSHWLLVVAGNRDELHSRPSRPLHRWEQPARLIAGKDLASGGSWLGISELGRFAAVTNLRGFGAAAADRPTRGALVTDVLSGEGPFSDPAHAELSLLNPFNLIIADRERASFTSNRPQPFSILLAPGIYGLSNGALDEPWPKALGLKHKLFEWIEGAVHDPKVLIEDLRDETLTNLGIGAAESSDIPQETPISPIFIRDPIYGTRCSTVVAIDNYGKGVIIERRYNSLGLPIGETALPFSW